MDVVAAAVIANKDSKGWQLPQNSTTVGTKSYSNLLFQAGVIGKITDSGVSYPDGGFEKLTGCPMSFLLAGNHSPTGTSVNNRGYNGSYWFKSSYSTTNAYNLTFNSSAVDPRSNNTKAYGFTVRCVAL